MSENIVPFRARRPSPEPNRDELVQRIRTLAADSINLKYDHLHIRERLDARGITMRQILEVLRHGSVLTGPSLDEFGDWRLKLKRRVAGRRVQVVVAVKEDHLVVVTAI